MSLWKEYYTPTSIAEALRIRASTGMRLNLWRAART